MKITEKTKKIYESPSLIVTEFDTKDIIMTSGLITAEEILGYGTIDFDQLQIEIDLN